MNQIMSVVKNIGTFPENKSTVETIARQSAGYLLDIRKNQDKDSLFLDVMSLIFILAKFSMEHKELLSYLEIRKYCRNAGHTYPPSLDDVAANEEAFAFYSKQLMYYLVDLWGDEIR